MIPTWSVHDRVAGILVFLPVPAVLVLFTQAPLGVGRSIALGLLLMGTHRLYARPFALRRAARRCLWCGGSVDGGVEVAIAEPGATVTWRACRDDHAGRLGRLLGWADRHAPPLRGAILGTLGLFLPAALAASAGRLGPVTVDDTVAFFRLGIALTVLPLAIAGPRAETSPPLRSPFPLHLQALLGTAVVLWLFRLVGAAWLVLGGLHLARRF